MGFAVMAAAALAQGYSAYQQTAAQKQAATYNAKVQATNARIAEQQAADAEARGRLEEDAYRKRLGQMEGQQRSALAATGVQLGTGSALDLAGDLGVAGDIDSAVIRMNAQREAYGLRLQGLSAQAQSNLSRQQAGYLKPTQAAAFSLLGSGSQFASQWWAQSAKAGAV